MIRSLFWVMLIVGVGLGGFADGVYRAISFILVLVGALGLGSSTAPVELRRYFRRADGAIPHEPKNHCQRVTVASAVCYLRFTDAPHSGRQDLGYRTARGEMLIADIDAAGRIVGLELVGPGKPCQEGP
jgi:hypothetical protein